MTTEKSSLITLALLTVLPGYAFGQSSCQAVYAGATTNMTATDRESAKYNYVYAKHCESDGTVKSSSQSQDLTVDIFDYVEVGWKGSQAEALQRMTSFCKTQQGVYASADRYSSLTNTVVVAALNSFNQCVALERDGARFSNVVSATQVTVTGELNEKQKQHQVLGVQYDPAAGTCTTTAMNPPRRTKVDRTTKAFTPHGVFSINCERIGTRTAGGETKYPRFEVTVATSQGPYLVTALPEGVAGYDLASENMRFIARADAQNAALRAEMNQKVAAEQAKTAAAFNRKITPYVYVIGDGFGVPCVYPGNAPTPQDYMKSVCGARDIVQPSEDSTSLVARDGRCGVNAVSFACADRWTP